MEKVTAACFHIIENLSKVAQSGKFAVSRSVVICDKCLALLRTRPQGFVGRPLTAEESARFTAYLEKRTRPAAAKARPARLLPN
jgi:hypothetical protein